MTLATAAPTRHIVPSTSGSIFKAKAVRGARRSTSTPFYLTLSARPPDLLFTNEQENRKNGDDDDRDTGRGGASNNSKLRRSSRKSSGRVKKSGKAEKSELSPKKDSKKKKKKTQQRARVLEKKSVVTRALAAHFAHIFRNSHFKALTPADTDLFYEWQGSSLGPYSTMVWT
ncbi:MAG: hypothetical protein M1818_006998 [Claussenomyces sp. TS43310]|nr:MAG: hypothetical protein M1818_006998 [Claussenomyces sp. TS43310]